VPATTRVGFITDLHADLGALQAALAAMDAAGVDLILCGGDLVDGGGDPEQLIALLRDREIPTILGNHDRWAIARHDEDQPAHEGSHGTLWMRDETIDWLRRLPTRWAARIDGVQVAMCHGTPLSDMDGLFPDEEEAELNQWLGMMGAAVLLCGHTHIPMARRTSAGLVANPGALWRGAVDFAAGTTLDLGGTPARAAARHRGGSFGILELPSCRWTMHRLDLGGDNPDHR